MKAAETLARYFGSTEKGSIKREPFFLNGWKCNCWITHELSQKRLEMTSHLFQHSEGSLEKELQTRHVKNNM